VLKSTNKFSPTFVNFTVLVECDKMLTTNNCHMLSQCFK